VFLLAVSAAYLALVEVAKRRLVRRREPGSIPSTVS
jgi:hypothetical protein